MVYTRLQSGNTKNTAIVTMSDVTINSSNKTLTMADVGSGAYFELLAIRVELIATAEVGTRSMIARLVASSDDDVFYTFEWPNNTITASQTQNWQFQQGRFTGLTTTDIPMPTGLHVFAGQELRIFDFDAIDAAADDMVIHVMGRVHARSL